MCVCVCVCFVAFVCVFVSVFFVWLFVCLFVSENGVCLLRLLYLHALPNARMLNTWLNIKNNCSMKKIKNLGMSCNSL